MTAPLASAPPIAHRLDRVQLALRMLVVVAGLVAVGSIRLAATDAQPALDVAIIVLVTVAALFPDGHAGLAAVAVVGVDWVLAVDDASSAWVMVLAVSMVWFHAALALTTVSPIGARPEPATLRRWARRTAVVAASVPPTWLAVVAAGRLDVGTSQLLVGAALLVVAASAMWSRRGSLN